MRDRILHLADLHLGDRHEYLGAKSSARRLESDRVLERAVDWALDADSRIGGVLIAGDLFDVHDPAHALVESVLAQLGRLTQAGLQLLTVPGNHDEYSYPNSVYRKYGERWPGTLVTLPSPSRVASWDLGHGPIDLFAMAFVAGRSRPPYDVVNRATGDAEATNRRSIYVLHGSLDADWTDRSLPIKSDPLARNDFDYVALGHIHRPMQRRLGRGWVAYPGRIEGGGFDDPGGASLLVLESSDGLVPVRVPFESRRIESITLDLSGLASPEELAHRIEALGREDGGRILRVRLTGIPPFSCDAEALRARWEGWFFHLVVEDERAGTATDAEIGRWSESPTVKGAFLRRARAELAAAADDEERAVCAAALRFGIAAFGVDPDPAPSSRPGAPAAPDGAAPRSARRRRS